MSLSRAELEAMDRDELIETLVGLSQTVEDLQVSVSEDFDYVGQQRAAMRADISALTDRIDALETENQRLRDELADVRTTSQTALQAAAGEDSEKTQTQVATDLTRNWLIVKAANATPAADRPVTIPEVQDRAETHGHDLKWQTVRNGWDALCSEWPQFYETTKNGDQALSLRPSKVTPPLAKVAQVDLGRDDLTKRFVGESGEGSP